MSAFKYAYEDDNGAPVYYYKYKAKYWREEIDRFVLCGYLPSEALRRGYLHPYQELTSI